MLGLEGAAEFAGALLGDAVARLSGSDSLGVQGELVFAPPEEAPWFQAQYGGIARRAQRGTNLAARLEAWFEEVLGSQRETDFAAAVGSDSPWTSRARVAEARELLAGGADVVLGPDLGGGYYLVALGQPVPGLFRDIEMSTRSMFDETCELVAQRGLKLALLDADYDVDEASDWVRLRRDLKRGREGAPRVAAFVEEWEAARP